MTLTALSVTPSPYQRDFFAALAARPGVSLRVFYQEANTPDSPWPETPLALHESVLPGRVWGRGRVRCHWNTLPEKVTEADAVLLNSTLTSVTLQRLVRAGLRHRPWFFWGELLRRDGSPWKNWMRDRLASPLNRAAGIFAVGSVAVADYQRRFPGVPVWNMPYRCNLEPFIRQPTAPHSSRRPVTFLFCGQMIARKGVDVLLAAFARVVQEGHDVNLLLSGREADLRGWLNHLDASVRALVDYRGFTAPADLPSQFAEADVFVMPSRHDGWGVVINQAIGAGLPIIATDAVGAAHDLVKHEINGLRVPPGDEAALTSAMIRLATDADLRRKMALQTHSLRGWLEPINGAAGMIEAMIARVQPGRTATSQAP